MLARNFVKERVKDKMICQKCGKQQATVHFTNIINGMKTEYYFCDQCAATANLGQMEIQDLISGFFGMQTKQELETMTCDFCHSTLADVKKRGKAGCSRCYETFASYLDPIVRKVHGNDTHVGKEPFMTEGAASGSPETAAKQDMGADTQQPTVDLQLAELQEKMRQAVAEENYEEAARLRDAIAEYKEKGAQP